MTVKDMSQPAFDAINGILHNLAIDINELAISGMLLAIASIPAVYGYRKLKNYIKYDVIGL